MALSQNRKRSAADSEIEKDLIAEQVNFGEQLKRNRSTDELEATRLIAKDAAWRIDMTGIVSAFKDAYSSQERASAVLNNFRNYDPPRSLFILCIIGGLQIHYKLLCNNFTSLVGLSQHVQVIALALQPQCDRGGRSTEMPSLGLPEIAGIGASHNHFLKLGLLHPLGGGKEPLDAIVVIDAQGRRRLVLPIGWGAGRYVNDGAGGKMVQDRLMMALKKAMQELDREIREAA